MVKRHDRRFPLFAASFGLALDFLLVFLLTAFQPAFAASSVGAAIGRTSTTAPTITLPGSRGNATLPIVGTTTAPITCVNGIPCTTPYATGIAPCYATTPYYGVPGPVNPAVLPVNAQPCLPLPPPMATPSALSTAETLAMGAAVIGVAALPLFMNMGGHSAAAAPAPYTPPPPPPPTNSTAAQDPAASVGKASATDANASKPGQCPTSTTIDRTDPMLQAYKACKSILMSNKGQTPSPGKNSSFLVDSSKQIAWLIPAGKLKNAKCYSISIGGSGKAAAGTGTTQAPPSSLFVVPPATGTTPSLAGVTNLQNLNTSQGNPVTSIYDAQGAPPQSRGGIAVSSGYDSIMTDLQPGSSIFVYNPSSGTGGCTPGSPPAGGGSSGGGQTKPAS